MDLLTRHTFSLEFLDIYEPALRQLAAMEPASTAEATAARARQVARRALAEAAALVGAPADPAPD